MAKVCSIYVYSGEGAGKTTAALGLALRAVGHGYKVIIVQFMKGWKDIGELKIQDKLGSLYEIHQFGTEQWINLKKPSAVDKKRAKEGLQFALQAVKKERPFLLILDEINLALAAGLLVFRDVRKLIDTTSAETTLVFTGRSAPKELLELADFVSEIRDIKHPIREGIPAKKGIQY